MDSFSELTALLDQTNPNLQTPEIKKGLEKLLADGVELDLYKLGFENLRYQGESFNGMSLKTHLKISQDPNKMAAIETNPMAALSFIVATANVSISDEIYARLIQEPQAMMLAAFEPRQENGYKIYDISFDDKGLVVNNKSMR